MAVLLAALLPSCQEKQPQGQVVFTLGDVFSIGEVTRGQVSDYTTIPSASDFDLVLSDDYSVIWSGKLSDWDVNTVLSAGNYKVVASYGTQGEEGRDKPVFSGTKTFTVSSTGTQTVSIDVSLQNSILAVYFSNDFKKYFSYAGVYVTTALDNEFFFNYNNTAALFIDPSRIKVEIGLTNQGGAQTSLTREYTGLMPATCYTMYFGVSDIGGNTFTISFDDRTETIDLGIIDLNK